MGTCQEGCLGYYQEESPDCEGWCEVCGVCYDKGYCTREYCADEELGDDSGGYEVGDE